MKSNKHILFSALFLFVFLSAFSSGIYISLSNSINELAHFSKSKELKSDMSKSGSEDFVFEENKTETEDGFEVQALVLPYFNAVTSFQTILTKYVASNPIEANYSKPIYLSVGNFRI